MIKKRNSIWLRRQQETGVGDGQQNGWPGPEPEQIQLPPKDLPNAKEERLRLELELSEVLSRLSYPQTPEKKAALELRYAALLEIKRKLEAGRR